MNRVRIWIAITFPAMLVGIFEFFRHRWLDYWIPGFWGNVASALIVAVVVYGFIQYFVETVARAEQDLGRSRAEVAVLAERHRIGREMHDSVAQTLFHLRVRLEAVGRQAEQAELTLISSELNRLHEQVGAAYNQVRAAISDLKRQADSEDPAEALRRTATRIAGELGVEVRLDLIAVPPLDMQGQQHLLAIVSEAISNARRHGGATVVRLNSDQARLTLVDNGRGFDPRRKTGGGFGLMIMEERARMLGGQLSVEAAPGKGCRITLRWEEAPS